MSERDFEFGINHPVLQNHRNLLWELANSKTMCVYSEENGNLYIEECCDNYYTHDLTRAKCIELSELFRELAEAMK